MGDERRTRFGFFRRGKDREPSVSERRVYLHAKNTMLAWNLNEGRLREIIDFNLNATGRQESFFNVAAKIKISGPRIDERQRTITTLQDVAASLSTIPEISISDRHTIDFAKAQVAASINFARRLRGEKLPLRASIETANDVDLEQEVVPDEILEQRKDLVLKLAAVMGLEHLDQLTLDGFRKDHQLNNEEAKDALEEAGNRASALLEAFLRTSFVYPSPIQQESSPEAYWSAWSDTDPKTGQFRMRQNLANRIWTQGRAEELGFHEKHHIHRMGKRKDALQARKLDRLFGLTTVHGPEAAVEEGLAQTITLFIPGAYESLSPEGKFQVQSTLLRQMVYSNVSIKLATGEPSDPAEIAAYVQKFVPWETKKDIDQQITWRTNDRLNEVYLPSYGFGARHFLIYESCLSEAGKREFLNQVFARPYTLKQTDALFKSLMQKQQNIRERRPVRTRDAFGTVKRVATITIAS